MVLDPIDRATHHLYARTKSNSVGREGVYWEKAKPHIG